MIHNAIGSALIAIGIAGILWGIVVAHQVPFIGWKCATIFTLASVCTIIGTFVVFSGYLKYGVESTSNNRIGGVWSAPLSNQDSDRFIRERNWNRSSNTKRRSYSSDDDSSSDEEIQHTMYSEIQHTMYSKRYKDFCKWYPWDISPSKMVNSTIMSNMEVLIKIPGCPDKLIQRYESGDVEKCRRVFNALFKSKIQPEQNEERILKFNSQVSQKLQQLARISHTFSGNSHTLMPDLGRQGSEAVLIQHCPHYPDGQSQAPERRFASKKCEKSGLGIEPEKTVDETQRTEEEREIRNSRMYHKFCKWYPWREAPDEMSDHLIVFNAVLLSTTPGCPFEKKVASEALAPCKKILHMLYKWKHDPVKYAIKIAHFNKAVEKKLYERSQESVCALF